MKSVKLASILLASGMLLGTVHTAVTPAYTAHADQGPVVKAQPVNLEGKVEVDNNRITGFNNTITKTELEQIFDGGELLIPETIGGEVIMGIANDAFNRNHLKITYPVLNNLSGIATLNFATSSNITYVGNTAFYGNKIKGELDLENVMEIGDAAFYENELTSIDLPKVTKIGDSAFYDNKLTSVNLPNVQTIDIRAFESNALTKLELENVMSIGSWAFGSNRLTDIDVSGTAGIYSDAFSNQELELEENANKRGEVSVADLLQLSLKRDGAEQQIKLAGVSAIEEAIPMAKITNNAELFNEEMVILQDKNIDGNIVLWLNFYNMESMGNYSINPLRLTIKANSSPTDGSGNTGDNGSTETDTAETPGANTPGTNTPETPIVISPDPEVNRPHTVYAKRAMRLHSNVSLTSPTKSYKKQSRAKAKSFRVLGVSYDKSGKKRYKVKGGYITASTKYVADSHFRSSKVKQVRVIGNRVNSYKNVKLSKSQKVRSYKKGTKIKVKRIVKHGRTTRFQLNNGRYITGNKQLLIMDHSK